MEVAAATEGAAIDRRSAADIGLHLGLQLRPCHADF
jgi:hypothetical protein